MKLATSSQMQALDQAAMNRIGIPGVVLMENAGKATVDRMETAFGPVREMSVIIFVGPGNNGGDGLVIGRHVLQRGGFPYLVFLVDPDRLSGDAAINRTICEHIDLPSTVVLDEDAAGGLLDQLQPLCCKYPVHSMVDALFGTGLQRRLEGRFAAVVHKINELAKEMAWPVTAVDIPSGISADTGATLGCCVQADLTVTFGLAKPGHFLNGGQASGSLAVVDISIPARVIEEAALPGMVLDPDLAALLLPRRKNGHKGSFGHLAIAAGSEGKTGAAILCASAALQSGCGLVTLFAPRELNPVFEACLPEAMTIPLPGATSVFGMADYAQILNQLQGKSGLVIGPGIGTGPDTGTLVRRLYRELPLPMVVDADALNLLAMAPDTITDCAGPRILTPHPGEMSRLTGLSTGEIQADRLAAAGWLAGKGLRESSEIVTVLKGAGTVVSSSDGRWAVNRSGNSGMATGGMGDVLAGLIGSLLVQGYAPWDAACIGVYLHGLAADMVAEGKPYGFLASEVAATLPLAAAGMRDKHCCFKEATEK